MCQIWSMKSNSQQKTNMIQTLTRLLFISKLTPVSSQISPGSSPSLWSGHVHSQVRRLSETGWMFCLRVFLRASVYLIRLLPLLNAVTSCHTPSNHFLFQLKEQTAVMIGQKTDYKTPEGRRFFMNNKLTDCYRRTSENVAATGNSSHQIKPSFKNHEFSGFKPDTTHKVGEGKKQK